MNETWEMEYNNKMMSLEEFLKTIAWFYVVFFSGQELNDAIYDLIFLFFHFIHLSRIHYKYHDI